MSEAANDPGAEEYRPYTTAAAESDPATRWPKGPPVKGHIYGFICPATGVLMASMTMETWQAIDESFRKMKAALATAQFDLKNARQHSLENGGNRPLIISGAQDPRQR